MITDNKVQTVHSFCTLHWSAIIAGAFVGLGLGFLLNLFSIAIGLSAYAAPTDSGTTMIAIGGVLGLIIGTIVAMGAAGFVAGYLARIYHCCCHASVVYGFITWSLALILATILLAPMTSYLSSYEQTLSPNASISTTHDHVTISKTPVSQEKNTTINASPKHLMGSAWLMFGLFFLGAFSSCLGACWGMCCNSHKEHDPLAVLK